jgi:NADPH-dependent F420 reductase
MAVEGVRTLAVIGGTGAEGGGLALRWAHAGHHVIIGSRQAEKAVAAAAELNTLLGRDAIKGMESAAAVEASDIVVLAVPFAAQKATALGLAEALAGKVLVDVTVPLMPPKVSTVQLPASASCVVDLQSALGDGVRVVSAFQNVSAHKLKDLKYTIACDVLVCGNDKDARQMVVRLAGDAGLRGVDAGPLANSTVAESLTSVLIWINKTYKIPDAGISITGLPAS